MLMTIFTMCAIMVGAAGYDCDEKWAVYIYDDFDIWDVCYPGKKSFHHAIAGCAMYDDNRGYQIILGRGGTADSHTGDDIFLHEIKHLSCLCNYHANPPEPPRR